MILGCAWPLPAGSEVTAQAPAPHLPEGFRGSTRVTRVRKQMCRRRSNSSVNASRKACTCAPDLWLQELMRWPGHSIMRKQALRRIARDE